MLDCFGVGVNKIITKGALTNEEIDRIVRAYERGRLRLSFFVDPLGIISHGTVRYFPTNAMLEKRLGKKMYEIDPKVAYSNAQKLSDAFAKLNDKKKLRYAGKVPVIVGVEIDGISYQFMDGEFFSRTDPVIEISDVTKKNVIYDGEIPSRE
jgi:hypothetical protein